MFLFNKDLKFKFFSVETKINKSDSLKLLLYINFLLRVFMNKLKHIVLQRCCSTRVYNFLNYKKQK